MDSILPILIENRHNDVLYRYGRKEAIEEAKKEARFELVKRLLLEKDFTIARIASLVNVSEYFVRKVKRSLPL